VPPVIESGKKLPSLLDPGQEKRLLQLEEDRKKLLEQIEEKEKGKRQGLREWEKLERESARDALRSELAEGHLERLSGEGGGSGAY
jgi:predicted HTH transcriptional regulator